MHAKVVKSISLEDNGNVKVNKDKSNTVELVYVDLE